MAYTLDDLDNAIANSVGPQMWVAIGPETPGFCRPIAMDRAVTNRWYRKMPEDSDAYVIREAYADLCTDGCLRPSDGWDDEQGEKQEWE